MRYIAIQSINEKPFAEAIMYKMYKADGSLEYVGTWNEDELITEFELDLQGTCKHGDFFISEKNTIMIVNINKIQDCIDAELEMFYKNSSN